MTEEMLTIQDAVALVKTAVINVQTEAIFDVQMGYETEEDSKCIICNTKNVNVFVWKVYDQLRDKILEFKFCKKCLLSMASEINRTCENKMERAND